MSAVATELYYEPLLLNDETPVGGYLRILVLENCYSLRRGTIYRATSAPTGTDMHYRTVAVTRRVKAGRLLGELPLVSVHAPGVGATGRLDRAVAIASLVSSFFLGGAAVALTMIGLNVTRDFNDWQKNYASRQEASDSKREAISKADALKERCIGLAIFSIQMAKEKRSPGVDSALSKAQAFEPNCRSVGVDIVEFVAAWIVKNPSQFAEADRQRAARIVVSSARPSPGGVKTSDRFYLGEPQFRGFDIRGVGPRIQRMPVEGADRILNDAIGGSAYYRRSEELEIPLGPEAIELGLNPSISVKTGIVSAVPAAPRDEPRNPGTSNGTSF